MLQSAYLTAFGTKVEKLGAKILLDDGIPCLNTNASYCSEFAILSKKESERRRLYDLLQNILGRPGEYSPQSVLKALELVSYLLSHGSDFCVEYTCTELQLQIGFMKEYNSAIILNEKNILYRIKGGSSDKGEPVRELAEELEQLLITNTQQSLLKMRDMNLLKAKTAMMASKANNGPSNEDLMVDFGGGNVSHKKENKMTSGGFGSGLGGKKKGKQLVVGAQYTLEDMLAEQRNRPMTYCDDEQKMKRIADEKKMMMDLLNGTNTDTTVSNKQNVGAVSTTDDLLAFDHTLSSSDKFGDTDLLGGNEHISQPTAELMNASVNVQNKTNEDIDALADIFNTQEITEADFADDIVAAPPVASPPPPPGPPPSGPPPSASVYTDPFAGL